MNDLKSDEVQILIFDPNVFLLEAKIARDADSPKCEIELQTLDQGAT